MRVLVARGRRVSLLPIRERSKRLLVHVGSRVAAIRAKDRSGLPVRLGRWCATIVSSPDISGGISPETRIPGFRDSVVPVSGRTREDTVYSSTPQYKPDEPVSVSGSCTGTSHYTGRQEGPDYGPRQTTRPTGRDVRGSGACLRHHSTG